MVRLLSLLILLLLPNPFATRDAIPVEPEGVVPAAVLGPVRPRAIPASPAHSRAPVRARVADALSVEPVSAPADTLPVMADPLEPPTL